MPFVQHIGMQDVSSTTLRGEVELECAKASLPHARGHFAGAAEDFNEEGAGYEVEVSRPSTGVSTFWLYVFGTD